MGIELEKALYRYGRESRKIVCERREENVLKLMELEQKRSLKNPLADFVSASLGMPGQYCVVWQALWFAVFCLLGRSGSFAKEEPEIFVSVLLPLLIVFTIEDISRIYHQSLLELESTTKYPVVRIVMFRMSVLTFLDYVLALAGLLFIRPGLGGNMEELLLYGLTPMLLSEAALWRLMRYFKGEELKAAGFAVYGMTAVLAVAGRYSSWQFYGGEGLPVWKLACLAGVVWGIAEYCQLGKDLKRYGTGHRSCHEKI